MMPTPLFVLALQAACQSWSEDKAPAAPKDRRSSIRLVWNADAKPALPTLIHTKER